MTTTIERWTPLRELELMDRRMRDLFNAVGLHPALPAADVYETDDEFVVELEAPGFTKDEVAVEVTDHALTIRGAKSETTDEEKKSYRFHERLEREFERRFPLPESTDPERLKARFDQGLIKVRAPKAKERRPHKIPIGT